MPAFTEPNNQSTISHDRLCILMVGLPARGKSYMSHKVLHYLQNRNIISKIFNVGSYRRNSTKNTTVGKISANFFDPDNVQAATIRKHCCFDAMNDLISWYDENSMNEVAILDATNTTLQRRQLIRDFIASKVSDSEYKVSLIHIECICNHESIIHNNIISGKLKNDDYCTVNAQKAIADFRARIKMYEKRYCEVRKDEGSYIKIIRSDVGTEIVSHNIKDFVSMQIMYFLDQSIQIAPCSNNNQIVSELQHSNSKNMAMDVFQIILWIIFVVLQINYENILHLEPLQNVEIQNVEIQNLLENELNLRGINGIYWEWEYKNNPIGNVRNLSNIDIVE